MNNINNVIITKTTFVNLSNTKIRLDYLIVAHLISHLNLCAAFCCFI